MIAISSFRPFSKCAPEIAGNQINAFRSWRGAFSSIIYFGEPEAALQSSKTQFVPCDGLPTIRQMTALAATKHEWSCIINADIIVSRRLHEAEAYLTSVDAKCGLSKRCEIPEDGQLSKAKVVDLGLDFFCATPHVWRVASQTVQEDFRLGRIVWDTWMLCFFMEHWPYACFDLTPSRLIYHPKHGNRRDQNFPVPDDPYLNRHRWPRLTLKV